MSLKKESDVKKKKKKSDVNVRAAMALHNFRGSRLLLFCFFPSIVV